jgi:hypothetical protein
MEGETTPEVPAEGRQLSRDENSSAAALRCGLVKAIPRYVVWLHRDRGYTRGYLTATVGALGKAHVSMVPLSRPVAAPRGGDGWTGCTPSGWTNLSIGPVLASPARRR